MNEAVYITESAKDTKKLARGFAKQISKGVFMAFYGNLGSGKTTFIQGLAQGLGVKRRISSPTFIIMRRYDLKNNNFYHLDLYRTRNNLDILGLGIDEVINDKNNIIALEWAERLNDSLPKDRIELHFKYLDEDKREIKIIKYG